MSSTDKINSVDVQDFIDNQPVAVYQWLILLLCFLVTALDGLDTAAVGFIAPALRDEWGLSPSQLNPVMGAALLGLMLGAFAAGPLAERVGRKTVLLFSVLFFGFWSLASAWAGNVESLAVLRFLTGLGLGGAMPNAITLTSEYCPARRRSLMITSMFCGFTLGSALGGIVAAHMVPLYGWRSMLALGGALPLLLLPLLVWLLPESVRFLVLRGSTHARVERILRRISGGRQRPGIQILSHGQSRHRCGMGPRRRTDRFDSRHLGRWRDARSGPGFQRDIYAFNDARAAGGRCGLLHGLALPKSGDPSRPKSSLGTSLTVYSVTGIQHAAL